MTDDWGPTSWENRYATQPGDSDAEGSLIWHAALRQDTKGLTFASFGQVLWKQALLTLSAVGCHHFGPSSRVYRADASVGGGPQMYVSIPLNWGFLP